jgi:hypothetical protein
LVDRFSNRAFADRAENWLQARGIAVAAFAGERHNVDSESQ